MLSTTPPSTDAPSCRFSRLPWELHRMVAVRLGLPALETLQQAGRYFHPRCNASTPYVSHARHLAHQLSRALETLSRLADRPCPLLLQSAAATPLDKTDAGEDMAARREAMGAATRNARCKALDALQSIDLDYEAYAYIRDHDRMLAGDWYDAALRQRDLELFCALQARRFPFYSLDMWTWRLRQSLSNSSDDMLMAALTIPSMTTPDVREKELARLQTIRRAATAIYNTLATAQQDTGALHYACQEGNAVEVMRICSRFNAYTLDILSLEGVAIDRLLAPELLDKLIGAANGESPAMRLNRALDRRLYDRLLLRACERLNAPAALRLLSLTAHTGGCTTLGGIDRGIALAAFVMRQQPHTADDAIEITRALIGTGRCTTDGITSATFNLLVRMPPYGLPVLEQLLATGLCPAFILENALFIECQAAQPNLDMIRAVLHSNLCRPASYRSALHLVHESTADPTQRTTANRLMMLLTEALGCSEHR
ncbi:hypothetical protein THASP1DRAFT_28186 [Thamnocephalis sphaerospora]|uniref:Uncharacterized protein n=1 Tax=Thamnocephalis sphaerospora TaxID=78915 RepID=A0A4P9XUY5_9FUNG|nr:hypothetical protein THASP1DRAFT_28186 [Thamnocephalis sphaerospora]|eukprot:RKP10036.1 hypothetical protein THASP1DRAFT_28186 [Thamnocephalis sphaerospora]